MTKSTGVRKAKTLFDHLKEITANQDPLYWTKLDEADRKSWSTYMILRFLSMQIEWVVLINEIQKYAHKLEPPIVYELLIGIIPKSKVFLKYVKADTKKGAYPEWLVDVVKTEYVCKTETAVDYIDILRCLQDGSDAIVELSRAHGIDEQEIHKLEL